MPKARQRNREIYDRGARIYAMAANESLKAWTERNGRRAASPRAM